MGWLFLVLVLGFAVWWLFLVLALGVCLVVFSGFDFGMDVGGYFWCWLVIDALLASRRFSFMLDIVSMLTRFPFHAKTGFSGTPTFDECFTFWSHPGVNKVAPAPRVHRVCTERCAGPLRSLPRASPEPLQSLSRGPPERSELSAQTSGRTFIFELLYWTHVSSRCRPKCKTIAKAWMELSAQASGRTIPIHHSR